MSHLFISQVYKAFCIQTEHFLSGYIKTQSNCCSSLETPRNLASAWHIEDCKVLCWSFLTSSSAKSTKPSVSRLNTSLQGISSASRHHPIWHFLSAAIEDLHRRKQHSHCHHGNGNFHLILCASRSGIRVAWSAKC